MEVADCDLEWGVAHGSFLMPMDIFNSIDNLCLPELRTLLSANPDVISTTDEDGRTPLHFAATPADPEPTLLLLERGAQINARDGFGKTPLHIAAYNGRLSTASILAENGASLGWRDNRGMTPENLALENGKDEIAGYLRNKQRELENT